MRWDLLADDVEKEVASGVAEEFKLFFEVCDDIVEIAVRAEVVPEVAVFGVEFDDALCVVDDCGKFSAVTDDTFVLGEFFELFVGKGGYSADLEAVEGFVGVGPLGVDDLPGHAALEYGFAHNFEIVVEGFDLDLRWGAFFIGHGKGLTNGRLVFIRLLAGDSSLLSGMKGVFGNLVFHKSLINQCLLTCWYGDVRRTYK